MTTNQTPARLHRAMPLAARAEAAERREWDVALSSGLPVLRYDYWESRYYYEVLEHSADAIDLSRAERGLPLVEDHTPTLRMTVGRVLDIGLREDGKLAGRMFLTENQRGVEITRDIDAGILGDVSIGYEWLAWRDEYPEDKAAPFVRRITRWRPYEATLTPVPADVDVGVGRADASRNHPTAGRPAQEKTMDGTEQKPPATGETRVESVQERAMTAEMQRREHITAMVAIAELPAKLASELIAAKADVATASERIFEAKRAAAPARLELTEKEQKAFSFSRAIAAAAEGNIKEAGFEAEISEELYKRMPAENRRSEKSFCVPMALKRNIVATNVSGRGPELVREDVANSDIQELLRNATVLGGMNVPFITGITGVLPLPRQIGASNPTIQAQKDLAGTDTAASAPQYEIVNLTPFTISGYIPVTRQALVQVSPDLDRDMINELVTQHGIVVDALSLAGTGTGGNPTGILNTAGVNVIDHGTNGGAETLPLALAYARELAIDNALDGEVSYLTTPANYFRNAGVQAIAGTDSDTLINVETGRMRNGMRAMWTNQLPANLTKGTGTNLSAVIAANFARFFRLYFWGEAAEFVVDPYTQARKAIIGVNSYQYFAPFVRIPAGFAVARDVVTT